MCLAFYILLSFSINSLVSQKQLLVPLLHKSCISSLLKRFLYQVHFELRKWLHDNVGAEVAASTRIIYGGILLLLVWILCLSYVFYLERSVKLLTNHDKIKLCISVEMNNLIIMCGGWLAIAVVWFCSSYVNTENRILKDQTRIWNILISKNSNCFLQDKPESIFVVCIAWTFGLRINRGALFTLLVICEDNYPCVAQNEHNKTNYSRWGTDSI